MAEKKKEAPEKKKEKPEYVPMEVLVPRTIADSCARAYAIDLSFLAKRCPWYVDCGSDSTYCGRGYKDTCVAGFCKATYCPKTEAYKGNEFLLFRSE